ncbi:hypothetical protein NQ314_015582 [Rhamnusium bicolor]|uniref:RING-type E3 ubiquitin transferase n=1 Tax=Rhamnusium bicolor TaxID=1586634 RepID=A0AAV8WXU8_9CUCU|nr:hypothetical protein NQ314_015582 [Rhamnusium bicolor]
MNLYEAKVADVLRLSQRDEAFLHDVENQMHSFFKLMGARNFHKMRKTIPVIANVWYYLMTSLGNLQTLGEEYTGGEPLLERLLKFSKIVIIQSTTLTQDAKSVLLRCIDFVKEQRLMLTRIHHSVFYIRGKYYNISNRIMGIHYVLLRQWLQDDSFTGSFNILGNLSLFYILFNYVHQLLTNRKNINVSENITYSSIVSKKICVLCAEHTKSPCATPCGHIFCWNCIYDSLSYQKSCPICRENVNPSRIIFLQNYV